MILDLFVERISTERKYPKEKRKMAFSWKYAQHAHTPYWGPVTAQAK